MISKNESLNSKKYTESRNINLDVENQKLSSLIENRDRIIHQELNQMDLFQTPSIKVSMSQQKLTSNAESLIKEDGKKLIEMKTLKSNFPLIQEDNLNLENKDQLAFHSFTFGKHPQIKKTEEAIKDLKESIDFNPLDNNRYPKSTSKISLSYSERINREMQNKTGYFLKSNINNNRDSVDTEELLNEMGYKIENNIDSESFQKYFFDPCSTKKCTKISKSENRKFSNTNKILANEKPLIQANSEKKRIDYFIDLFDEDKNEFIKYRCYPEELMPFKGEFDKPLKNIFLDDDRNTTESIIKANRKYYINEIEEEFLNPENVEKMKNEIEDKIQKRLMEYK